MNILEGKQLFRPGVPVYLNINHEADRAHAWVHSHDCFEVAFVSAGQGIHLVDGTEYPVSMGDIFILNAGTSHVFIRDSGGPDTLTIYNCVFRPEIIDQTLIHLPDFGQVAAFLLQSAFWPDQPAFLRLRLSGSHFSEIRDLYHKMQLEFNQKPLGYGNVLRACVIELMTKIFRYREDAMQPVESAGTPSFAIIKEAAEFLRKNYSQSGISLEAVAMRTFLSKSHFSRLFSEVTGQHFSDYLRRLRIAEACRQLRETDMKVVDVMESVGYKDIKHFNRIFLLEAGVTPREYRKLGQ